MADVAAVREQIATALGRSSGLTFFQLNWNDYSRTVWIGILGLGLSEAAYMAEVNGGADAAVYLARGGIRRRFKRSSVVVVAPIEAKPTEPAPVEAKAKKGGK